MDPVTRDAPMGIRIAIAANSSWNVVKLRAGLIRGLEQHGYESVVLAPADPEVGPRMKELGVQHIAVTLSRSGLNPIADLGLLFAYRRALRRISPKALLGFTIKPNIYGCLAARMLGVPAIANISGLGTAFIRRGPLTALVSAMYRVSLRRAAVVFFHNSEDLELFVSNRMVRREQSRLLPGSGVDCDRFTPTPLPSGPPKFLLIARLLRDKGVREYVKAARLTRQRHPDAIFQLLGPLDPGNRTAIQPSELEAWVREGAVEYLGAADDVRPFIAASSAVVLPSFREGLPRSLLEGAAMARPLIAADAPGSRDVVEHGVNGLLCEVSNADALADAFQQLIAMSSGERDAMGLAGRRLVEQRFSEKYVIEAYLDVLSSIIGAKTERCAA
jgi:glycosyltransferase involved in cell wall biosynthesis